MKMVFNKKAESGQQQQLWFRGIRSSKFRHVFGEPVRREKCYDNLQITKNAHDTQFCAVNPKFVAIVTEVAGGGAFVVIPIDSTGRLDFNANRVTGHSGPILDIKWNPFNDNTIASCSDDCTVKLWHIPDNGLTSHLTDWLVELRGHKRRVAYIEWHPTAENILFSAGFDHLLIVWDVEKGEARSIIDCHPDCIHSMSLNWDGSLIATTCKDKKLRVIEPRSGKVLSEGFGHFGSKASKVVFLKNGLLFSTGFSRHSDRQYSLWNQNDLSNALHTDTIDSSSGIVFPFYDPDTNIVYLAGKGDGNIRYYEITSDYPYVHFLNQFLSGNPQRGLGFMPKRGLQAHQCEIARFYKLHAIKGLCEPIRMIVPRKADHFHADLFPDTVAPKPALSAKDWLLGKNAQPVLMSLRTGLSNVGNIVPVAAVKPQLLQQQQQEVCLDNNRKKWQFLSQESTPADYRPKDEKSHKTSTNTKFQQLQQRFQQQHQPTNNSILDQDLRAAYDAQSDEIRKLKKQLSNSEKRVRELEEQIRKLALIHN